jgi:formate dehydrogenase subunit gamma
LLPLCVALSLSVGGAFAQDAQQESQVQRQQNQPYNNAPTWRDVRSGQEAYTSVKGPETGILIQSGGETWRQLRNGPATMIGGWALVLMMLIIGAYYKVKGTIELRDPPTGRKIARFTHWDRIVHWSTAISFSVLGISGLIILFGKHLLLPLIGYTLFGWLTQLAKGLHNFIGPLFILCAVLMFITFVKDNLPRAYDFLWVRKLGGLFSGEHVPSHRFNAGEKAWFWGGLAFLGLIVSASGLVLDFPNFGQTRNTMQFANIVHMTGALMFIVAAMGHIYMGTIGMGGAYDAMRTGEVDEAWAKEHHEYWYNDVKSGKIKPASTAPSGAAQPQGGDD